jgi:DNA modification methylase
VIELHHGDCLQVLRTLPDNSVDSIVTDPPYGLSFMGKKWDYDVPSVDVWAECLRVLKPGGHLLAFAGTRTQHRMAVRIEDAGFEIRDMIAWIYGSGFPKSLDVSKAIDAAAGEEREVVGLKQYGEGQTYQGGESAARTGGGVMGKAVARGPSLETAPATEAARQWQGWGTALKPSLEPITMARKPLIGTVAANVLEHGTGGLNIDACRIATEEENPSIARRAAAGKTGKGGTDMHSANRIKQGLEPFNKDIANYVAGNPGEALGRWPANLLHDGSAEVVALFPETCESKSGGKAGGIGYNSGGFGANRGGHDDSGGNASRFFYCAKASKDDRDGGLHGFQQMPSTSYGDFKGTEEHAPKNELNTRRNTHPTVKPTDLMRHLCRLVTPPGGTVLDPFAGSGSTGKAAAQCGFGFIGIEREAEYIAIAQARIQSVLGMFDTVQLHAAPQVQEALL